MSDLETVLRVDHYNGIKVEQHNGVYGLLAMQKGSGENEVWYKKWVFLSKWKNGKGEPNDKKQPMAVRLGDKETALKVLREAWEAVHNAK
jgi:hypothetical protein